MVLKKMLIEKLNKIFNIHSVSSVSSVRNKIRNFNYEFKVNRVRNKKEGKVLRK